MIEIVICNEMSGCAAQLAEVFDDAVEGFQDIVTCGYFGDEGDDVTCRTDFTT